MQCLCSPVTEMQDFNYAALLYLDSPWCSKFLKCSDEKEVTVKVFIFRRPYLTQISAVVEKYLFLKDFIRIGVEVFIVKDLNLLTVELVLMCLYSEDLSACNSDLNSKRNIFFVCVGRGDKYFLNQLI